MKAAKIFILIVTILLSFHIVSALEIDSYKITSTPNGEEVHNIIELTITNDNPISLTEGSLTFALDTKITAVKDSFGPLEYTTKIDEEKQKVTFIFTTPIDTEESRVITLETTTYNIVQKEGYFEYLLVLVPTKEIHSFTHILKLENNGALREDQYLIVPDAQITENENTLFVEWATTLEEDTPTIFLVRFDQEIGTNWWKIFGITILLLATGILIGILTNTAWTRHKKQKALKAAKILNIREHAVLEYIIKNGPKKQYELVKKLNYTKSNMSKILKRLEMRGLIAVKKEGKVRIISVGEKISKEL
jgi:uncharacterized membrane protein